MKIVIAMDSFKGSLHQQELNDIIEEELLKKDKNLIIKKIPIADGGEGSIFSMLKKDSKIYYKKVKGPNLQDVKASYLINDDTAYLEISNTSGLELVANKDVMNYTTYGLGELISDVLDKSKRIVIFLGGSATSEGGAGMLSALGVKFYDDKGRIIYPTPNKLKKLMIVDVANLDRRLKNKEIIAACDVTNPLLGKMGANNIYAKQKGATNELLVDLEKTMERYANLSELVNQKISRNDPATGAAGGVSFALVNYLNAKTSSGVKLILEESNFVNEISDADLVITGEGTTDKQTLYGKAAFGVIKEAKKQGVRTCLLSGKINLANSERKSLAADQYIECKRPDEHTNHAIKYARQNLRAATKLIRLA